MIAFLARIFGGGLLDRVLSTVDKRIQSETDREKLKADLLREHLRTRPDFMRSGGAFLMMIFAVPLAVWFAAVIIYSILFCAGCVWPQTWTIAALPPPLNDWAVLMVTAIFGVVGLSNLRR